MSDTRTAKPPRRKLTALALGILLPVAGGAGVGYLAGASAVQLPWLRQLLQGLTAWDLLALPVLIVFVLGVHELGHLAGGISRGMRFLLLIVGPFQFSRSDSGIRFNWVFNLGTLGGVAAATPDPALPLTPQLRRLIVGGPLASLLLAALALLPMLFGDGRLAAYSFGVCALSTLIFVVTALPLRAGGFMSDGLQWLELRRGGAAVIERQQMIQLMGQSYAGVRPRDWDPQLIAQMESLHSAEPLRTIAARLFAFYHHRDREDAERTAALADWLGQHAGEYPDGFRQALHVELALHAAERGEVANAEVQLRAARGGVVDAARRALARAALARAQGDPGAAAQALAEARRALPRSMDPGTAQLTRTQIDAMERHVHSAPA